MKKIQFLILLGVLALILCPLGYASAQLHDFGSSSYSLEGIVKSIVDLSWLVFEVIAVICFVIAGILFLSANGEPAKLILARSAVIWGIAGVAVGIIAYSIIKITEAFLGGS